jgi:hypothetical protein
MIEDEKVWIVPCPGPGDPHSANVPKANPSDTAVVCGRCLHAMSYPEWIVLTRQDKARPPQR